MTAGSASAARAFRSARSTAALVGGLVLAAASLSVVPAKSSRVEVLSDDRDPGAPGSIATDPVADGSSAVGTQVSGPNAAASRSASPGAGAASATGALSCAAGRNGGSTDVGVTATSIQLGATVVQSGIGASFLGDVRYAMQAVKDRVNRAGGICGRQLNLKLVDDGWDFQRGGEYIRNLVEQDKVFALAVEPSSEGLKNASDSGYITAKKVPVVGTDGLLIGQYRDPYIWPVAASTVSTMHIMAKHAYDTGARRFGIVYESTYHFGVEGAYAFNAAVKRLTGSDIPGYSDPLKSPKCQQRFCGIVAGAPGYGSEIQTFNSACGSPDTGGCDFIALLLEPATAVTWMKGGAKTAQGKALRLAGPQPLFTYAFGNDCGQPCDQLQLWTGYYPPLGDFLGRSPIAQFVADVHQASASADTNNSFVEGGYAGMELLVKALQAVGPNLTRERLKAVLDAMDFDSGLSPPLHWRSGNHFANVTMQAFTMQYKSGFAGWRDDQIVMSDPWVGQDGGT